MSQQREQFGTRLGFILISAGCAIGLGNVYKFPIWCGAYGGGIFLVFYIAFLILLGIPVMCCELSVGRGSQRSIANSFDVLEKKGQKWHWMKYLGVTGNYALMMCYTCITGWFVTYFWRYLTGSITAATEGQTLTEAQGTLMNEFLGILTGMKVNEIGTLIVVAFGFGVCALGLQKGVEKITKVMMVMLFALLIGIAIYACTMDGAGAGLKFYFVPSLANVETNGGLIEVITHAMSQAFFTLSLGIGSIAIFGSYIGKDRSLLGESLTIIGLDTFVALMSGLILFPAYFTFNPQATGIAADEAGATFLFKTLSSIFNQMGSAGRVLGTLFFLFMSFAALSTVIAVLENIMSFWIEWTTLSRKKIALINFVGLMILVQPFILGNCTDTIFSKTIFLGRNFGDFEDFFVSNLALPFGSLIYTLFCTMKFGWGWDNFYAEVNTGNGLKLPAWLKPYMSYVLPVIILTVLIMSLM